MKDLEKRASPVDPRADSDSLPTLVGRLGEDVLTLLDSKLGLLKIEFEEEITAYARDSLVLGSAGVVVVVGCILLSVAAALLISMLVDSTHDTRAARYAFGFLAIGAPYLIVGALFVRRATRRRARAEEAEERA